jgi:YD repeat-containing protein
VKRPQERRVWYAYPGQVNAQHIGGDSQPSQIARVLDTGVTQLTQMAYNAQGKVTSRIDPLGRQTTYIYASNGIDLLEVRQVNGGSTDLLAVYGNYTSQHLPGTITDAAGQTTTITYNAAGQPLTVTNAKSEVTTYVYNTDGDLETVTGPVTGSITT